jgi:ribonuclease Z
MVSAHVVWSRISAAMLAACCALGVAACDRVQTRLIERMAARALTGDRTDLLDDGQLHLVLCGTGSPIADPERASACTAVLAGGHFLLIDAGSGSSRAVALLRLPRARLEGILLTHFHSDHIGELGEATLQSWVAGRRTPLLVYGPPGVEDVVAGFRQAYIFDTQYRVAHHGAEAMPPAAGGAEARVVSLPAPDGTAVVFDADGLRISAFSVDHEPVVPAYGYRIDYRGRSAVVSGDTKPSANLVRHARDADLLIHEALAAHMIAPVTAYARAHDLGRWAKLTSDVVDYHTTPVQAAEEAKAANVRMLVLTHIVPPLPNFVARRMFLQGVSAAWDGRVVLGADGMMFSLPPDSTDIRAEDL